MRGRGLEEGILEKDHFLLHQQGLLGVWLGMLYPMHSNLDLCPFPLFQNLGHPAIANYTL